MSLLHTLSRAIFTGDKSWAWRRRMSLSGAAVGLAGFCHGTWFDHDIAHASIVLTNAIALFAAAVGAYTGAIVVDDHLKRKATNANLTGES